MNLNLVNLTGFALAFVSGVHAADGPFGFGLLRGSFLQTDNCDDGIAEGEKKMRKQWEKSGADCDDAWTIKDTNKKMKKKYPKSGNKNWRVDEFNSCAQKGIDYETEKIQKECFEDDPSQCIELGEAAATQIALREVCPSSQYGTSAHDYEASCRKMAYDVCKGNIASAIGQYCPSEMPGTSELNHLGKMCPAQVDKMIGRGEGGEAW